MEMDNRAVLVIDHLRELGNGRVMPEHKHAGICIELSRKFDYRLLKASCEQLELLYADYPHYSGDVGYPIRNIDGTLKNKESPRLWYRSRLDKFSNWGDCKYADRRRLLCLHMADYFEKHGLI